MSLISKQRSISWPSCETVRGTTPSSSGTRLMASSRRDGELLLILSLRVHANFNAVLGHSSVPAFFGRALLDKYPTLLHDVYDLDKGMYFFLAGLPAWTPWPTAARAHTARFRLWQALDDHQRALDASAEGNSVDPSWGDLDDVSELVLKRNKLFRGTATNSTFQAQQSTNSTPFTIEAGFDVKERADLPVRLFFERPCD